jgi:predicted secreted protein
MPFLIILGLIGGIAGLHWWAERKAAAAPGGPPPNLPPTLPPGTPVSRSPKFVAPFVVAAPRPTYAFTTADSGKTLTLHVGETVTVDVPQQPMSGVQWWSRISDQASGTDESKSALYPFGSAVPGNGPNVQTWGAVAVTPGQTQWNLDLVPAMADPNSYVPQARFTVTVIVQP